MNGSKKTLGVLLVVVLLALAGCQVTPPEPIADALGQYDWLCGYSDGTRYMEIGRADN